LLEPVQLLESNSFGGLPVLAKIVTDIIISGFGDIVSITQTKIRLI
jgi:hypothetical protein